MNKIIVALDVGTISESNRIADCVGGNVAALKVGLELITSEGAPNVVSKLSNKGKLFFDCKFKDIPNTVAGASRAVARLGVWMFNVHCLGGSEMMKAARKASEEEAQKVGKPRPLLIGVTVLTSMDINALKEIGYEIKSDDDIKNLVVRLAVLAKDSGLDGVVASPKEISVIRKACGKDFIIVTPGVRPEWAGKNDQKRIMTPKEAVDNGADYVVIGRPITNPPTEIGTPANAIEKIMEEI